MYLLVSSTLVSAQSCFCNGKNETKILKNHPCFLPAYDPSVNEPCELMVSYVKCLHETAVRVKWNDTYKASKILTDNTVATK